MTYEDFIPAGVVGGVFEVHADEMAGEFAVRGLLDAVENEIDQVESAQQRRREVDVLWHGQVRIILATNGVGGGKDTRARVQRGDDAGFGDRDGLLFHDFVQDGARGFGHLVELVDAADTSI